ncbi:hypothetical protein GE09DRAFT_722048 [Coniochaeta sp. 2T2.1]|nr:hypothetical protein GE09DRAFT_722048 [Coniochaeta sp. 2T2.1]
MLKTSSPWYHTRKASNRQTGAHRGFSTSLQPYSRPHFAGRDFHYLRPILFSPIYTTETRGCWQIPYRRKRGANQLCPFGGPTCIFALEHLIITAAISSCETTTITNFLTPYAGPVPMAYGAVELMLEIPQLLPSASPCSVLSCHVFFLLLLLTIRVGNA